LLLPFGKNSLKGEAKYFPGYAGMEKHFDSNPIRKPSNKCRYKWDKEPTNMHKKDLKKTYSSACRF